MEGSTRHKYSNFDRLLHLLLPLRHVRHKAPKQRHCRAHKEQDGLHDDDGERSRKRAEEKGDPGGSSGANG